jgi:hypothetical protein
VELQAHLQRQEARFAVTEVPDDLVQALHDISLACWRDLKEGIERSAGEQRGTVRNCSMRSSSCIEQHAHAWFEMRSAPFKLSFAVRPQPRLGLFSTIRPSVTK